MPEWWRRWRSSSCSSFFQKTRERSRRCLCFRERWSLWNEVKNHPPLFISVTKTGSVHLLNRTALCFLKWIGLDLRPLDRRSNGRCCSSFVFQRIPFFAVYCVPFILTFRSRSVAVMISYYDWIWTFRLIRWSWFSSLSPLSFIIFFSTVLLFLPLFLLSAPLLLKIFPLKTYKYIVICLIVIYVFILFLFYICILLLFIISCIFYFLVIYFYGHYFLMCI